MRVGAAIYGAFIFEYLHPIVFDAQLCPLLNPSEQKGINIFLYFSFFVTGICHQFLLVNDRFDLFQAHQWNS